MTGHEILALLAPPSGLIDWLDRSFASKVAAGQRVPVEYTDWLTLWQNIRSIEASPIDGATQVTWAEVGDVITHTKIELAF
jgi:hypothetical protein